MPGWDTKREFLLSDWPRPFGAKAGLGVVLSSTASAMTVRSIRHAINNRFRTGTDKGNPTV